jgi:hypothetical protein
MSKTSYTQALALAHENGLFFRVPATAALTAVAPGDKVVVISTRRHSPSKEVVVGEVFAADIKGNVGGRPTFFVRPVAGTEPPEGLVSRQEMNEFLGDLAAVRR